MRTGQNKITEYKQLKLISKIQRPINLHTKGVYKNTKLEDIIGGTVHTHEDLECPALVSVISQEV